MLRDSLLIFDLDGTICDPIEGIRGCINYALEEGGHPPVANEVIASFIGPPLNVAFESILQTTSKVLIDALIDSYRERYLAVGCAECVIYPGVEDTLRNLSSHGVRLAVCTSKRHDLACRVLEHLELDQLFQFVDGGEVRRSKGQQLEALTRAGKVTPGSVMIGDRSVDIEAGRACGLLTGGVLWGYGSWTELEGAGPEYLFSTPSEWNAFLDPPGE